MCADEEVARSRLPSVSRTRGDEEETRKPKGWLLAGEGEARAASKRALPGHGA